jgi:threonine dehydrogenase-like Zn-dependent dehydrogenase
VRVQDVAEPKVVDPTDVVVKITTSAVCGSDLHQYHGRGGALVQSGATMGHEFMGTVEDLGPAVTKVRRGDRVIVPFSVSCGQCEWCQRRLPTQCATTGRAVFGGRFGHVWGGGQAQWIRVPFADHLCERVPAEMTDHDAIFLGDIMSTGYFCAENGGIRPGDTVAVFGAGPVGLLAMQSAQLFGPARLFAVDRVDYRLKLAEEFGAEPVSLDRGDPAEQLRGLTGGRGARRRARVRRARDAIHASDPGGARRRHGRVGGVCTSSRASAFRRARRSSRTSRSRWGSATHGTTWRRSCRWCGSASSSRRASSRTRWRSATRRRATRSSTARKTARSR